MKRILTLSALVIMAILTLAAANSAYAITQICEGTVKHDDVVVQGAIVRIYQNGCLAQSKTDTTDANGYFCVPTSLSAGNYEVLFTNAPHIYWESFYYDGSGYPTDLGIIDLVTKHNMQDCIQD